MTRSIVRELVRKDLELMKIPAVCYWAGGILAIAVAMIGNDAAGTVGMILFVSALFGVGIHSAILTVAEERRTQVLAFIMSLPVTMREYTSAKLIANLLLVGGIWLMLSGASYVIFIGEAMPLGAVPFVTIVLVAILLAYVVVLATALLFETMAPTIIAVTAANLLTQALLWWIADLHAIRSTIGGNAVVWNGTVMTILTLQFAAIIALLAGTYLLQARKTSFV